MNQNRGEIDFKNCQFFTPQNMSTNLYLYLIPADIVQSAESAQRFSIDYKRICWDCREREQRIDRGGGEENFILLWMSK